jgi:hypothetical protein
MKGMEATTGCHQGPSRSSYLKQRNMMLVWINWGEREMNYQVAEGLRHDPEVQALWGAHKHIHKEFFVYDAPKRRPKADRRA